MNYNRVETLTHTLNVLHSVAYDIVEGNNMDNLDLADIKTAIQMLTGTQWNGERKWQWNDKITIPVPKLHIFYNDTPEPSAKWCLYVNDFHVGYYDCKEEAEAQAESLWLALIKQ